MRQHATKLIAKTNNAGLFNNNQLSYSHFEIHVDSSHHQNINKTIYSPISGMELYSTGWIMHEYGNPESAYSFGAHCHWDTKFKSSNVFETEGIINTLKILNEYFDSMGGAQPLPQLTFFNDNQTTLRAFAHWKKGSTDNNETMGFSQYEAILKKFRVNLKWEKGHSKNKANNFADSLANRLWNESIRYGNLTPLQMCGVLARQIRSIDYEAYHVLQNDYIFQMFSNIEKSVIVKIDHSFKRAGEFIYKVYEGNEVSTRSFQTGTFAYGKIDKVLNKFFRIHFSDRISNTKASSHNMDNRPRAYFAGSAFDGNDSIIYKSKSGSRLWLNFAQQIFEDRILLGGCCSDSSHKDPNNKTHEKKIQFNNWSISPAF